MLVNADFAEQVQTVLAFAPVNIATAANTGAWVSLKNFHRCTIRVIKAVGTAGEDPVITVQQATAVAGTGAKALNFERVYVKQHATALPATFTRITQTAANTYTNATLAEELAIIEIDILPEMLDIDGGFDCVQVSVPDPGSGAQLMVAFYDLAAIYRPPLTAEAN
jgi:hypothetical protein